MHMMIVNTKILDFNIFAKTFFYLIKQILLHSLFSIVSRCLFILVL